MIPLLAILRANWRYVGLGLIILALGVQSYRVGLWKGRAHLYEAKLGEVAAVQEMQNVKLEAWAKSIETHSRELAHAADTKYQAGVAAGNARAEQYIASHRVRAPQDRGQSIHPATFPTPDDTDLSNPAPADPVLAEADDIRICSALYDYALGAYEWAQEVGR